MKGIKNPDIVTIVRELEIAISSANSLIGIHALRTKRPSFVAVSVAIRS